MRFEVVARGAKGHSGVRSAAGDLSEPLIAARTWLQSLFARQLTLEAADGWVSQARYPFMNVGTPGVFNITAPEATLGVEVRPIPSDRVAPLREAVDTYCHENNLEVRFLATEDGVACNPDNPALQMLIEAIRRTSGASPRMGKKLAGTSARFAPDGQGVVWGQSGIGPHAKDERHYIPSILPYYQVLDALSGLLVGGDQST
jgi:acetylornithine deacetylase/succinyl-diaminopimelate desuccinylase-like protein